MIDKCVDCDHWLDDHDTDSGIMVGACTLCDCDGYKEEDEMEEGYA